MIGPELAYPAVARARLRELLLASGLSARELASAVGVSSTTIERHLARGAVSSTRRTWYHNVESVTVDEGRRCIQITVAYTAPTRKPDGWSRESRERSRSRS